jgi:hypothetical protein
MARARKAQPAKQPDSLKGWEGYWVALLDGEVIEAAHSPRELAAKLHARGPAVAKAVARYVPEPSDVIVIGVG